MKIVFVSKKQAATHDSTLQLYPEPKQNQDSVHHSFPRVIDDAVYASMAISKPLLSVQDEASQIGRSWQGNLLIAIDNESSRNTPPCVQGAAIKLSGDKNHIDDLLQPSLPVASHSLLAGASARYDNHQQEPTSNPPANSVNLAQECGSRGSVGDTGILADALSQPGAPDPQDLSNRRIAESPNRRGAHFAE